MIFGEPVKFRCRVAHSRYRGRVTVGRFRFRLDKSSRCNDDDVWKGAYNTSEIQRVCGAQCLLDWGTLHIDMESTSLEELNQERDIL
jgi:hypothetical protein